jgi:hypothetical protein
MIRSVEGTGFRTVAVTLSDRKRQYASTATRTAQLDGNSIDGDNGVKTRQKGRHLPSRLAAARPDHKGRCPHNVVIVQHFAGSVKAYIEAFQANGCVFPLPDRCPHPDCQAAGSLIRWGRYERGAITAQVDYRIRIQRVRCKACGRTHSLLPDFLHPHRHFVIRLLQHVVSLYLLLGLGWRRLMRRLHGQGPARSTVREWVASFAYGAGCLLLDRLVRALLILDPGLELPDPPPEHLRRVSDSRRRGHLHKAYTFWLLAERLYAQVKVRRPHLHFTARQLFPFLLHWLHGQGLSSRLFWSPLLLTTPTQPF